MGWARRMLLGDWGTWMDLDSAQRGVDSLKRSRRSKRKTDIAQNKRLDELETENDELKVYISSLIQLLVSKDVLKQEEVVALVDRVEGDDE